MARAGKGKGGGRLSARASMIAYRPQQELGTQVQTDAL